MNITVERFEANPNIVKFCKVGALGAGVSDKPVVSILLARRKQRVKLYFWKPDLV
jgi:hypothetical protein